MKEKRTKKESNKEEAKEEGRYVTVDVRFSGEAKPRDDLKVDWPSFITFFNATLHRCSSCISPITFLSKGKKSRVQALVNNYGSKQALVTAIEKMARSDFLNGRVKGARSNRSFIASFIWLTESDDHFEKVLNGYYDNPPVAELTPEEQRQIEAEHYKAQQAERRAAARRIEEEEHERRNRERDERARNCVSYEEYQRLKKTHPALVGTPPVRAGKPADSGI